MREADLQTRQQDPVDIEIESENRVAYMRAGAAIHELLFKSTNRVLDRLIGNPAGHGQQDDSSEGEMDGGPIIGAWDIY